MQIRLVFVGAALLGVMAGCRSTPWETVANSKFGIDRFAWPGRRSGSDDAEPAKSENRDGESLPNSSRVAETRGGLNRGKGLSSVSGHLQSGYQAEAASRWNQAKMFYRRVLDAEPDNPLAHHRLAIIADKQSDFHKAEEHYLTALRANRNDPDLLSDLGYSFLLQNRQEESENYLRRALRANPSHSRAINNLGLLYSRRGDYDGALAMFKLTGPEHQALEKMRELFP
ncbi:MAG: tetratricopeptide repeat protein, partial [Planctomycetes bacterium]|nr:tetratricopeptide repeat protein [Planctomycetota bacterium]